MLAASLDGGALSYDSFAAVKTGEHGIVRFHYSLRSAADAVLERFVTELHGPILQRPLTAGEHAALLAFGMFHSTYALLPFATAVRKLQIRAGRVSEGQLSFFQTALEGALAEFYYLADMDLACALRVECCFDAAGEQQRQGMQQEQQQGMQQEQVPTALAQQQCQRQQLEQQPELTQQQQQQGHSSPDQQAPSGQQAPPDQQAPSNPQAPSEQQLDQAPGSDCSSCMPKPRVLVPFGGGKDSTLLMQLLHECGCDTQWAYFGEWQGSWGGYPKFDRLVAASPCKSVLVAEQNLPCLERLTTLNLRPDIHFPDYVAYVSYYVFSAAFLALQHGYDYICVGNEHSANAINLVHSKYGYPVNHQYEKSFAAEQAFNAYIKQYISPHLHYFSGLQHMSELHISQLFAARCMPYLPYIISCNWATNDAWCGGCEKCAFVYTMLSAFIPVRTLMDALFRGAPRSTPPTLSGAPGSTPPTLSGAPGSTLLIHPTPFSGDTAPLDPGSDRADPHISGATLAPTPTLLNPGADRADPHISGATPALTPTPLDPGGSVDAGAGHASEGDQQLQALESVAPGPCPWDERQKGPCPWDERQKGPCPWDERQKGPCPWDERQKGPCPWDERQKGPCPWDEATGGEVRGAPGTCPQDVALRGEAPGPCPWDEREKGPPGPPVRLEESTADMFDSAPHQPLFESLMGLSGHKPFECVGTAQEVLAALYLSWGRNYGSCGEGSCEEGSYGEGSCGEGSCGDAAVAVGIDGGKGSTGERAGPDTCRGCKKPTQMGGVESVGSVEGQGCGGGAMGVSPQPPLLFRRHLDVILGEGKRAWEELRQGMDRGGEGRPGVPTLYPAWYRWASPAAAAAAAAAESKAP